MRSEHERFRFTDEGGGLTREILSPTVQGSSVEVLRHILEAGASTNLMPPYPPGTEKYVVVQRGKITLIRGRERTAVQAGDTVFFEADAEHAFEASHDSAAEYLVITSRCLLAMPTGSPERE